MDKENNNKLKKYKKKLTTKGRVDLSKGGRVGYVRGEKVVGRPKPINIEDKERPGLPPKKGKPVAPPGGPKVGGPVKPPVTIVEPKPKPTPKPAPKEDVTIVEDEKVKTGKPAWWRRLGFGSLAEARAAGWAWDKERGEGIYIGDEVRDGEEEENDETDDETGLAVGDTRVASDGTVEVWTGSSWVPQIPTDDNDVPVSTPAPAVGTVAGQQARQQRAGETGQRMEDIATGKIGLEELGAKAEAVRTGQFRDEAAETITGKGVAIEKDEAALRGEDYKTQVSTREDVITAPTATTARMPDDITAAKAGVMQVRDEEVAVEAAREKEARRIEDVAPGEITGDVRFATVDEIKKKAGLAKDVNFAITDGYLADRVTGDDVTVAPTPEAEKQERRDIIGEAADDVNAAQILDTVGYTAAQQRKVTGKAAKGAAANMIAEVGDLPPEITAAIVEDPATVEAQVDTNPVEVNAAIAALPTEALVSSQMESLLGGMEDGKIPLWAKPAVDAVNAGMAQRGLSVSTVGRDSLFNAIIQSAMPMAQSNAQALQTRAAQNLSNEQQANLQQATQQQQLRMQNLANRQDAESQTAQMAQQMSTLQSQFTQQAVMTTAEQQQQTRMQSLANEQQAAVVRSQNQQAINAQELGNEQQINLAELQLEAQREGANQSAVNQERLAEMQIAGDFLAKNAGFKQQMELANLSNEQQMRLANLSSRNQAESERLSNAEKTELANLNKNMQTNLLQANIAKDLGIAQLNVDQQTAIKNASTIANMDMAKFSAAQQKELANSKFMQTVAITDMNAEQQSIMQNATAMASMDLANLGTRERLAAQNAKNFLTMDMANLNNEQQANMMKAQQEQQRLLSDQSAFNAAQQFNATSENQTNQFMTSMATQIELNNAQRLDASNQFNAVQQNQAEARRVQRDVDVTKFNNQLAASVDQFSKQQDFARDQFNSQNALIIEQSNVQWRRDITKADTAMQQQVNMMNAQNSFGMTQAAQSQLWQEMKDEFDYIWKSGENAADRDANMAIAGLQGDASALKETTYLDRLKSLINLVG